MTVLHQVQEGLWDPVLSKLYGEETLSAQRARYQDALKAFEAQFSSREPVHVFSAPGRTELGGNHTDHQHGRVLAASVNLDVVPPSLPERMRPNRRRPPGPTSEPLPLQMPISFS